MDLIKYEKLKDLTFFVATGMSGWARDPSDR